MINNAKSKELKRTEEITTQGSVVVDNLKKGTYYVLVVPNWQDSFAPKECVYELTAKALKVPAKPKLSGVKAGKKSAKVKSVKVK